jgi:hypothetical protein
MRGRASLAVGTEKVGEIGSTSPLLGAIADLREFICRAFEEQKTLLLSREAEVTPAPVSAPAPPVVPATPQAIAVTAEVEVSSPVWRTSARSLESPVATEPVQPIPADTGPGAGGRPEDPRQRLDALAKLLDRRLKPAAVPPGRSGDG